FVKRVRIWANAGRYISSLGAANLQSFAAGPPAQWVFAAVCGDGKVALIQVTADMLEGRNTTVFQLKLLSLPNGAGEVRTTVRLDIEDRNFHSETHFNDGAD